MKGFRVVLLVVLSVGAMSVSLPWASSQPQRAFAAGGDDEDDDDDDDDDDDEGGSSARIGDFTFGSGTARFAGVLGESQFDFAAESGPNGENATGFAQATSVFGITFAGPVTCLRVSGNRAAFEVDSNDPSDVVFFVGDNGPAGVGDEFNFHLLAEGADGICPDPNSSVSEQSVVTGDIVVRDNAPLPGSGGGDDDDEEDDD